MPHRLLRRADPQAVAEAVRERLEQALYEKDELAAEAAARLLVNTSCSIAGLYSEVVQSVLDRVGDRWAEGSVSISEEHAVTSVVLGLVSRLKADLVAPPWRTGRIVLMPLPGEAHRVGLAMLEHVLLAQGWRVSPVDPMPTSEVVDFVRDAEDVLALGLTVHNRRVARPLARMIGDVRQAVPGIRVIIGGLAVREDPQFAEQVGADGGAAGLNEAIALVERLINPLSPREFDVLQGVSAGETNAAIGERLGVRASTVKTHLERVFAKTGTHDRAAAVAVAFRRGWLR